MRMTTGFIDSPSASAEFTEWTRVRRRSRLAAIPAKQPWRAPDSAQNAVPPDANRWSPAL
ncbi:hypothetical protein [Streptomyces sp. MMG1121]|uniref:hypothetical protein n=1 Tax=Streptomyces sp. MMG1121 TaxID=1415544 RepID=UPI0006C0FB97|nr:hypothetical protein [Streptomyces sp. MMG1121]KOV66114.1 hypothetical protein ADK64_13435 [Streptomyces sp. MMG1121]